ncbi:MAG: hypothetical protein RLZZ574_829 [Cyanobacteriota bacterium]|jgi:mRNA-degrading endonuclease YafQ of YafQ-DinJ toxin-antitoxin module
MIKISFSSSFLRVFKKRIKGNTKLESRFWTKVEIFTNNPFDPSLRTHKLSGKLKDLWSFSVEYDERVLFYFTDDGNAIFIDIGNHDEVY